MTNTNRYTRFKKKHDWKWINLNNWVWEQCVSLIYQFLAEEYQTNLVGKVGNANQRPFKLDKLMEGWKTYEGLEGIETWDIIVSKTLWGKYWHIGLYDHEVNKNTIAVFNQNWWPAWVKQPWDECRVQNYKKSNYQYFIRYTPQMNTRDDELKRAQQVITSLELAIAILNQTQTTNTLIEDITNEIQELINQAQIYLNSL